MSEQVGLTKATTEQVTKWYSKNEAINALTDIELRAKCIHIETLMQAAKVSLFQVAVDLKDIKEQEMFTKAGFKKFNDFCEDVLGYKHAMCNNLIRIADRLLTVNNDGSIASIIVHDDNDYSVSQLQEMLTLENTVIIDMDENGIVKPEMTTKEIRKAVKAKAKELKGETEIETETETNIEPETETETNIEPETETETTFEQYVSVVSESLNMLMGYEEIAQDTKAVNKIANFKKWLNNLVAE